MGIFQIQKIELKQTRKKLYIKIENQFSLSTHNEYNTHEKKADDKSLAKTSIFISVINGIISLIRLLSGN